MHAPESPQSGECASGFANLMAKLLGPNVRIFDFLSGVAFGRYQSRSENRVEVEFMPSPLGAFR